MCGLIGRGQKEVDPSHIMLQYFLWEFWAPTHSALSSPISPLWELLSRGPHLYFLTDTASLGSLRAHRRRCGWRNHRENNQTWWLGVEKHQMSDCNSATQNEDSSAPSWIWDPSAWIRILNTPNLCPNLWWTGVCSKELPCNFVFLLACLISWMWYPGLIFSGIKKGTNRLFSKVQPITLSAAYIIVPQRYTLKIKSSSCFHVGKFWHKSKKKTRWSLRGSMWHTSVGLHSLGGETRAKPSQGKTWSDICQNKTRQLPLQDTFSPWKSGFDFWLQL